VALTALARLGLDQVWALVSPQNPLKPVAGMAPLAARLASARAALRHPRIVPTDIEQHLGTRFTADTLTALQTRFPRVEFVWIMGADSLAGLHRWERWRRLAARVPIAVLPRPGSTRPALAGQAARSLACLRRPSRTAPVLSAPGWTMLMTAENPSSATRIRAARGQT
jgi:nicotinate-nucleotide adenylyltransferase